MAAKTEVYDPIRQMNIKDLMALCKKYGLNFESTNNIRILYSGHIVAPILSEYLISKHGKGYIFVTVENLPPPGQERLVSGFAYFEAVDK
ncbi:MAG: hypothetical protein RL186_1237 [Pseudomonadota bacterium]